MIRPHLYTLALAIWHACVWRLQAWTDLWRYRLLWHLPAYRPAGSTVLLIKVDEIGDYVLVRDVLGSAIATLASRGHAVQLLLSSAVQPLAELEGWQTELLYLDKKKWGNDTAYTRQLLLQLRAAGYAHVYSLHYSRRAGLDDLLVAATGAPATGWLGNDTNTPGWALAYTGTCYRHLLPAPQGCTFEADVHRLWLAQALGVVLPASLPSCPPRLPLQGLPRVYWVVFPAAGRWYRQWPREAFVQLLDTLHRQGYTVPLLLAGGPADVGLCQYIATATCYPHVQVLAGRTSLPQLVGLIAGAQLLLCNETGALHIAAASGTYFVALCNANHYGRFAPYPASYGPVGTCLYPPELAEEATTEAGRAALCYRYRRRSRWQMKLLPVPMVYRQLATLYATDGLKKTI